ncbi:MAG: CinA family protein [Lachnospiraceae bacterium]|nr:CinA family protein [Lachnospiraceae bacterium]
MKEKKNCPDVSGNVLEWLRKTHKTISFAESCTAGLAAARLVGHAGASEVLNVSFVTYSEEAKIAYTDVTAEVLESSDVVSEPVARLMASGVRKRAAADIGVGITGYAGPGGGTEDAPVGTVVIGIDIEGTVKAFTLHFGQLGREEIRTCAVDQMYLLLWKEIQKQEAAL